MELPQTLDLENTFEFPIGTIIIGVVNANGQKHTVQIEIGRNAPHMTACDHLCFVQARLNGQDEKSDKVITLEKERDAVEITDVFIPKDPVLPVIDGVYFKTTPKLQESDKSDRELPEQEKIKSKFRRLLDWLKT